jgi:hypothetical protein
MVQLESNRVGVDRMKHRTLTGFEKLDTATRLARLRGFEGRARVRP